MKKIIVCVSAPDGNTMKLAKRMAEKLDCDIVNEENYHEYQLENYDLIGLGAGIRAKDLNKKIYDIIEDVQLKDKKVFVFSTSISGSLNNHDKIRSYLEKKEANFIGEFCCKGISKFFVFKLIGGINKKYPREKDLCDTIRFIEDLEII